MKSLIFVAALAALGMSASLGRSSVSPQDAQKAPDLHDR